MNDINKKVDALTLSLTDFENSKRKMEAENGDLLHQLNDFQISANILNTENNRLKGSLEEQNQICTDEGRERSSLLSKYRNLEHEYEGLRNQMEDEIVGKESVNRQTEKALEEVVKMKQKFDSCSRKAEELDMSKLKLQTRLAEAESTIETLHSKLQQVEKSKLNAQEDLAVMSNNLDRSQTLNAALEKKAKHFDVLVGEWKYKVDGLALDLNTAQKETRNISSELFRIKNAYEESVQQLDDVRKENKKLSLEIRDLMEQITEGGRSIHEIDKIRKRLESELIELESALTDAETALEQEENKVLRIQLEVAQIRQEIERKLADKEEEFQGSRKQMARALENLQSTLEAESKCKAEILRTRKKLESDVRELDTALEQANINNMESQKTIKGLTISIRDINNRIDAESQARAEVQDKLLAAESRANNNRNALEEARSMLDTTDRARRTLEQELAESNETLGEQTCQNQSLISAIRKSEQEITTLNVSFKSKMQYFTKCKFLCSQNDLDEMMGEVNVSNEKAQRAMVDAAALADELRAEQDLAMKLEQDCKLVEAMVRDSTNKLDDIEQSALTGGRKAVAKMETRIRELSSELDAETRRHSDAQKNLRKSERKVVELTAQQDEDRKNMERMQVRQRHNKVLCLKSKLCSGFDRSAPAEGEGLQEADRGCRGNCGSQPCKVSPNSINSGGRNTKGGHH